MLKSTITMRALYLTVEGHGVQFFDARQPPRSDRGRARVSVSGLANAASLHAVLARRQLMARRR